MLQILVNYFLTFLAEYLDSVRLGECVVTERRKVFIIGSKGTPAKYGGFETFVDNLVSRQNSSQINLDCIIKVTTQKM